MLCAATKFTNSKKEVVTIDKVGARSLRQCCRNLLDLTPGSDKADDGLQSALSHKHAA